jgi:hypothetical protein
MISDNVLLFIEPQEPASTAPLVDHLTRRITAAYRAAKPSRYFYGGFHQCVCGAHSSNCDYFLPDGDKTNSLCVHYLAHHRQEVPNKQLARVAALKYGEADPSEDELQGRRWRGNRPSDFFGKARLAAFADLDLDLASAFWAAEGAAQRHEYFHHALSNFSEMPEKAISAFIDAVRVTHGEVSRWSTQAFWSDGWKETWVAPLQELLRHPDSGVRQWAANALGDVGDTRTEWWFFSGGKLVKVQASGLPSQQAQAASRALIDIALQDPETSVRSEALHALGSIGLLPGTICGILSQVIPETCTGTLPVARVTKE